MKAIRLFPFLALTCLLAGGITHKAQAQFESPVLVRGQITDTSKKLVLYPATIRNKTTGARVFSDVGGYYRINANRGDEILISFVGYEPDSFKVRSETGTEVHDIRLKLRENFLQEVEISGKWNPYQLDSLARYEEFKPWLETHNRSLVDTSKRSTGGFGLVFSPFTRGSRKEKDLRKFKKLFAEHEKQAYVDYRYSKTFVSRVTGLSGDSLLRFTQKYTPTYEMLRNMNNETLIFWISERAKQWKKDPNVTLKPDQ
ncbi:carboxypeptidase-like regulatory domain-containing protein [Chitinophaga alhagiae]|uniref:carboxypeptidase-like regulatory domain-containing protein n=1 Tax=Chitinophaga alhagiae TaxID=2203219 RepID=UPI000E5A2127|nr:carboxypeptidase-like regulatory domain-containing protein [Chitinophaga alhagiae]